MISVRDLVYHYPGEAHVGLEGISLDIPSPSFTGILGGNGSGKSTLAHLLAGLTLPDKGKVLIDGLDSKEFNNQHSIRNKTALILQNPENQIVGTTLEEDIAFGLENQNMSSEEMDLIISECLHSVNLSSRRFDSPLNLSGGEQQRLVLAAMLARRPQYLILDEVTTMLDPAGRKEFLSLLQNIRIKEQLSIILITHYPEEVLDADQVILMSQGRILRQGSVDEILSNNSLLRQEQIHEPFAAYFRNELNTIGLKLADTIIRQDQLISALVNNYKNPHDIKLKFPTKVEESLPSEVTENTAKSAELLRAEDLNFSYHSPSQESKQIISNLHLQINEGERIALIGASGSGKSTLFKLLNGLLPCDSGKLYWRGQSVYQNQKVLIPLYRHVGLVFQDPQQQLFTQTVWDEVCFGPRNLGKSEDEITDLARRCLNQVGLNSSYDKRHPLALSGGEQRRVAIASVLAMENDLLLLDEPSAGLDINSKTQLFELLEKLCLENACSAIWISHRMEEVVENADKVWLMENGQLIEFPSISEAFQNEEILERNHLELPIIASFAKDLQALGLPLSSVPLSTEEALYEIVRLFRAKQESK